MKKFLFLIISPVLIISLVLCASVCPSRDKYFNSLSAESHTINLPIVMYHSVLKSRQSKYIVSPQQIENDFSAYHKMGYTPVFLREVVNFVDGKGALPAKPMVITFDDGHFNNMHYVLPIAKKFNFKIVINPVTSYSVVTQEKNEADNPSYSYLTLAQTAELEQSGLVEIGNHTHNMHKFNPRYGIKQRSSESETDYMSAVESDINRSQNLFISAGVTRPITFAYPFGAYNEIAKRILTAMGFRALLTCNEGISKITLGDPTSLHYLKRYNRSGNTTTEAFIKKVFAKIENSAVPE